MIYLNHGATFILDDLVALVMVAFATVPHLASLEAFKCFCSECSLNLPVELPLPPESVFVDILPATIHFQTVSLDLEAR